MITRIRSPARFHFRERRRRMSVTYSAATRTAKRTTTRASAYADGIRSSTAPMTASRRPALKSGSYMTSSAVRFSVFFTPLCMPDLSLVNGRFSAKRLDRSSDSRTAETRFSSASGLSPMKSVIFEQPSASIVPNSWLTNARRSSEDTLSSHCSIVSLIHPLLTSNFPAILRPPPGVTIQLSGACCSTPSAVLRTIAVWFKVGSNRRPKMLYSGRMLVVMASIRSG